MSNKEKIKELYKSKMKLYEEIQLLKEPDFSNGTIDVYLESENIAKTQSEYYITLCGSHKKIGNIRVTWESFSSFFGNIGYEIKPNYRGNHYTLQALELLKPLFIERGLIRPILTTYPDNIPSIKTIEEFGGKLIEPTSDEQRWNTYEVDLLENNVSRKH